MRGAVLRMVLVLLVAGGALLPSASTANAGVRPEPPPRPVVLVLVPEFSWANAPPGLDGYAKANLSVRSARARTATADGYLTVGKGAPSSAHPELGLGRIVPASTGAVALLDWDRLRRHDATLHQPGRLGALGDALKESDFLWAAVPIDPSASSAAAAADRNGRVGAALTGGAEFVDRALSAGAHALIVGAPVDDLPAVLAAADSACVIVASVSTPERGEHLGVLATSPACGLGADGLASPSTHHDHLATLVDVAPTFLSRLGLPRPPGTVGAVVTPAPAVSRSALVRRDERAYEADQARSALVWLFVALSAIGAATALVWPRARVVVAYALLAVPAASFLMMIVPWWRWGLAGAVVTGGLVSAALAVAAVRVGRHDVRVGVAALAGAAAAVVGVDALLGGELEIDAPFGNSAIVGARFFGVGNIASGFLAAGLLVAGGLALERWGRRALPAVVAALVAGVVVGGAQWFGADAGGVLAFVPAYAVLLLGWRRGRPLVGHLLLALVAGVAFVALFAAIDLLRPGPAQSHLGGAVAGDGQVDQLLRKADRALGTIKSPMALLIPIGAVALARYRPRLAGRPALRATAWALLVAGVAGSAFNDSGLVVGASVMAIAWTAFLALGAGPRPPEPAAEPSPATPAAADEGGVTVTS